MRVGVLTCAPWHNSIGDLATAEVTLEFLVSEGIPARPATDPDEDVDILVVGGGNLIGPEVDTPWGRLLQRFRPRGEHILNACGVDETAEGFDFLADYRIVTTRDNETVRRLQEVRSDVSAVPCPATLVRPYSWEFVRDLPGYEASMASLKPDGYVVVHRHPKLAALSRLLDMPVLVVDAQAWRSYAWHGAGQVLPSTHSSRVVQTVIANAAAVITNSLHLAIFAIGAATPFVAVDFGGDAQSSKVARYLNRAGMRDVVVPIPALQGVKRAARSSAFMAKRVGYPDVLAQAHAQSELVANVSKRERRAALDHLRRVASACV